jgi:hypothetical protein
VNIHVTHCSSTAGTLETESQQKNHDVCSEKKPAFEIYSMAALELHLVLEKLQSFPGNSSFSYVLWLWFPTEPLMSVQ